MFKHAEKVCLTFLSDGGYLWLLFIFYYWIMVPIVFSDIFLNLSVISEENFQLLETVNISDFN
jgi:hypothetical protein